MIGIFGGTFDPIHYGHLRAALEIQEYFTLEQVRLIPSAQPPHRQQPQVSASQRLAMLQLAIEGLSGFIADDRELQRPGYSYMVDTLYSLQQDFPQQTLLLCMGSDAFSKLATWHRWQALFDYAHILVMTRPGFHLPTLNVFYNGRLVNNIQGLYEHKAGKLVFQQITQLDISATAIRQMIVEGKNPQFLLPDSIIAYIHEHKLYQNS